MPYYVAADYNRGTFFDLDYNPLVQTSPGVYILPENQQCVAGPYPGYAFSEWIGAYVLYQTGGMLKVIDWLGGNYVQALFTEIWDYDWNIQNGEGPYTVVPTSGSYPTGMTPVDDGTSAFGTLIQSGVYPITVEITDSTGATASVSCDITTPEINADCNNPPDAVYGIEYSHQLLASGGTPPYYFGLKNGSLPPGLRIDPITGIITGTPVSNT